VGKFFSSRSTDAVKALAEAFDKPGILLPILLPAAVLSPKTEMG